MRHSVHEPPQLGRGYSTAEAGVVDYRLGRVATYVPIAGRWLDCGCAEGDYSVALKAAGAAHVIGTDIESPRVKEAAVRWADVAGVEFVAGPAEALPLPGASVDAVLLNEVLEHVADQERALAELRRVLVPGGALVVFSPNRWFPFEGHGARIGRRGVGWPVPLLPWLPQRLVAPLMTARNYWPWQLAAVVRNAGFDVAHLDYALPLFTKYPWLPRPLLRWYSQALPRLDRRGWVRKFGVSTVVVARKPETAASRRA
ncbi:MAG TPA: class I SAM-dependent methyltransferase [Blastococcus sp.]|jgi:ubiquinone/menaquinone biosynthesis C-methylase UbiE|nr:class I SAM-dependent methyltransferase [Blastococcus sp.]